MPGTTLHIFDFDGTLFNSPMPHPEMVERLYPEYPRMIDSLLLRAEDGGHGWLEGLCTLSPPAVPQKPEEERWFVMPVLRHLRALIRERDEDEAARGPGAERRIFFFVLTGRCMVFQDRLEEILASAGLRQHFEEVILKPDECAGRVKAKLYSFVRLISEYRAEEVFYYEDRPEQGGELLLGVSELQQQLFYGVTHTTDVDQPPLYGSRELNKLPSGGCCALPFTVDGGMGRQLLSWTDLFSGPSMEKHYRKGMRAAMKWTKTVLETGTIQLDPEWVPPPSVHTLSSGGDPTGDTGNKRNSRAVLRPIEQSTISPPHQKGNNNPNSSSKTNNSPSPTHHGNEDKSSSHKPPSMVLRPFQFTMLLMELRLALQCQEMLSEGELRALVDVLSQGKVLKRLRQK